ncbi:uridine kinase [bacterium]|nr:uridine kinase [bacterium]
MKKCILIGIAGGTGSGKTLVARNIVKKLGRKEVVVVEQDWYYKDLSEIPLDTRNGKNFDHPNSIDFELLYEQVLKLVNGEEVEAPVYDFKTHSRSTKTQRISGHRIIILEGILALLDKRFRDLMDIKLYVDTDLDIRFIRRLKRDIEERGRSAFSVIEQYETTVRPMHEQFVEPTKRFADVIIPEGGENHVAIDLIKTKIQSLLEEGKN